MSRQSELRNLLAAFGKGHQNIINLTLHVFTFPVLVASAAMVLDTLGGRHPMPSSWDPIFSTFFATYLHSSPYWTVGGLVLLTYTLYYVKFDPFIGTLWGICVALPGFIYGQRAIDTLHPAWLWALGVHIASWTVQYIGHQIEGSPLAMKDKSNNTGRRPIMVRKCTRMFISTFC
jgi:uncharacterized membrane protein YGL010W